VSIKADEQKSTLHPSGTTDAPVGCC